MKVLRNIARILVGIVFIFSGFVKGVDPLGTTYRIEDYFIAYGVEWAIPLSLGLAVFLCTLEFILGISLVFNLRLKILSWPLLLLMVYFLVLTFFDALYNPVPDCGCFGDALKLTNWQTLYKNLVLMLPVALIFLYRNRFKSLLSPTGDYMVLILAAILFTGFSVYQYRHLPMIDFRPWKIGTNMVPEDKGEVKIYVEYRNRQTGEIREYLSPNYPWNDSTWLADWEFVDQRVDESGLSKSHTLKIFDLEGNDITSHVIEHPSYQFIVSAYDLEKADPQGMEQIFRLFRQVNAGGYSMVVLTGSLPEQIEKYREGLDPDLEFYNADDVELKTMVRSNPGLILLRNGVVLAKWHYRDIPSYQEIRDEYLGKRD